MVDFALTDTRRLPSITSFGLFALSRLLPAMAE